MQKGPKRNTGYGFWLAKEGGDILKLSEECASLVRMSVISWY